MINGHMTTRDIKNLLFTARGGKTYLWVSITYESAKLDLRFLQELRVIVEVVRDHFEEWHRFDYDAVLLAA